MAKSLELKTNVNAESLSAEQIITDHIDIWTSAIEQKSSAGRGTSNKFSLYGIKKLRELILELAVRGKLVPQASFDERNSPDYEPASVLLERIAAEKLRLINEKKLKTNANEVFSDEDLYLASPDSWGNCRLGNLAKFIDYRGKTPRKLETGIRLLTAKNVKFGFISLQPEEFISEEEYETWMTRGFPRIGDILFTPEAPLGNVAIVNISEKFALAQRAICFQMHEPAIAYFLKIVIMSQAFQKQLIANATGMTATGIKASKLKEILVPIPPLEEQHRIVAKVDELMLLCDAIEAQTEASISAHQTLVETLLNALLLPDTTQQVPTNASNTLADSLEPAFDNSVANSFEKAWLRIAEHFDTLFTTAASIDTLKQTILQLAVMGKLVEQASCEARKSPNYEPAAKLLERIAKEKAQLIKDGKIKKQKPLPAITDEEKPFELPKGWEWVRFGNIAITRLGKMLDKAKNSGEPLPYLRNTNVQWDKFILDDVKLMKFEDAELEEFRIQIGDLLICEGGEPGRCAIWSAPDMEIYFQKAIHRARPFGGVMSKYLQLCLTVDAGSGRLNEYFTGATIKHFVGAKLNNYIHSLPPLEEQHRIVSKVDELMSLCDQLKARLSDAQTTQLHLTDAIVEQAV